MCDDVQLCNRCVREFLILACTWFAFSLPSKTRCDRSGARLARGEGPQLSTELLDRGAWPSRGSGYLGKCNTSKSCMGDGELLPRK
jgi:hypothetical protein